MSAKFDPVLISLLQRAAPIFAKQLAEEICGVQPMTGPTNTIFALKTRYGYGSGLPCCDCVEPVMCFYDYLVDFPRSHAQVKEPADVLLWAVLHCEKRFTYSRYAISCPYPRKLSREVWVWRWSFEDENDAFAFKMRWM